MYFISNVCMNGKQSNKMKIQIRLKIAGKRRDVVEKVPFDIPDDTRTAKDLITYIVTENVRVYNTKQIDDPLFKYLTEKEFTAGETLGKIGFDDRKNEKEQDAEKAIDNAIQCFEDGIYRILINENEVSGLGKIEIKKNDVITFIRLVMLAGRLW